EQNHPWPSGYQPVAKVTRHARFAQSIQCLADETFSRSFLEFDRSGVRVVGTDEEISILPLLQHRRRLGAKHGIDSPQLPTYFPANFKQKRLLRRRRNRRRRRWRGG